MRCERFSLLGIVFPLAMVSAAGAQPVSGAVRLRLVASAADFSEIKAAQINNSGDVAFSGTRGSESGFFFVPAGGTPVLAVANGASDGRGHTLEAVSNGAPQLDDMGGITFVYPLSRLNDEYGVYRWTAATGLTPMIVHGDPCPDGTQETVKDVRGVWSNRSGMALVATSCGTYIGRGSAVTRIDGSDIPVSGHPLGVALTIDKIEPPWTLSNDGHVGFAAYAKCLSPCEFPTGARSSGLGVFAYNGSTIDGLHFSGADHPFIGGATGEYVTAFSAARLAPGGAAAFVGRTSATLTPGLFHTQGGQTWLVARKGEPFTIQPTMEQSTWASVLDYSPTSTNLMQWRFWLQEDGKLNFLARRTNPTEWRVFQADQGVIKQLYFVEDSPIEDTHGTLLIRTVDDVRASANGSFAFKVLLKNGDTNQDNERALVGSHDSVTRRLLARAGTTYDDGTLKLVFRPSENFQLQGHAGYEDFGGRRAQYWDNGMNGLGMGLNKLGHLLFTASPGLIVAKIDEKLIREEADMQATGSVTVSGSLLTYEARIRNLGPAGVSDYQLLLSFPPGLTAVSPPPTDCEAVAVGQPVTQLRCWKSSAIGTVLNPSSSDTFEYSVRAEATGVYDVEIFAQSDLPDPNPANDRINLTATVTVTPSADLAVTTLVLDSNDNIKIELTNHGPSDSENAVLLVASSTDRVTPREPSGACPRLVYEGRTEGGGVRKSCELGRIGVGETLTVGVSVDYYYTATDFTITATLSDASMVDPNPANNEKTLSGRSKNEPASCSPQCGPDATGTHGVWVTVLLLLLLYCRRRRTRRRSP